jgi:hypothetical protein
VLPNCLVEVLLRVVHVLIGVVDVRLRDIEHLSLFEDHGLHVLLHFEGILHAALYLMDLFLLDFDHALVVDSFLVDLDHLYLHSPLAL